MADLIIQRHAQEATRVVVLNSSALICKGLEFVIQTTDNLKLVGTATNTDVALALIETAEPDLVITDVKTPLLDGILVTQTIKAKFTNVKVLILTAIADDQQIFDALWSGVDGYCLNDVSSEKVKNAIQSVLNGAIWIDASVAETIKKGAAHLRQLSSVKQTSSLPIAEDGDLSGLSDREIEVLSLISLGLSNAKIAAELSIATETVKTHIRHIMRKLAATDRTQAAVIALKRRIVQ